MTTYATRPDHCPIPLLSENGDEWVCMKDINHEGECDPQVYSLSMVNGMVHETPVKFTYQNK